MGYDKPQQQAMRLQKYIALCGAASRRKAEEWIAQGKVAVNGAVVTQMGVLVEPGDVVEIDGKAIAPQEQLYYVLLNKPRGCVSTVSDPQGRPTVMDYVHLPARVYPVGRLDYDTSGLLLLTNDGELAYKMMHPKYQVPKAYMVTVHGSVTAEHLERLQSGVDIGEEAPVRAQVTVVQRGAQIAQLKMIIFEGKNRQIRRMIEAVGLRVTELVRIQEGSLSLGNIPVGVYRLLGEEEIALLKQEIAR